MMLSTYTLQYTLLLPWFHLAQAYGSTVMNSDAQLIQGKFERDAS
jgi:hypothetical protein